MNITEDRGGGQGWAASRVFEMDSRSVAVVRSGDRMVFGELYDRHFVSTHWFACKLIGSTQDAYNLVTESFIKVTERILVGGGPTSAFRPYLLATVRTTFYKKSEAVVDAAETEAVAHGAGSP